MSLLKIRNEHGEVIEIPALKGNKGDKGDPGETGPQGPKGENGAVGEQGPRGEKGDSGVYIGPGSIPDGYNVQIDPTGEIPDLATKEYVDKALENVDVDLTGYATTEYVDTIVGDIQKTLSLIVGGV